VVSMVVGGRLAGWGDALVHLVALPALAIAVLRWRPPAWDSVPFAIFAMMTAALLLAFLQVVPLPEHLFACMPQRAQVVAEWHAAGLPATWRPMSLAPVGTLRAALAMACAMAMWMTCMQLPVASRIALLKLGVLVALPMALLGYAQAGAKADTTGANGLFENRNHFATLMAMLVPFALAAAHDARVRSQRPLALAWLAAMVALLLGAALSYSRAGTVLAFAAAVASLAVVAGPRQSALGLRANGLAIAAAVAVAVTAVAYFAWDKLAQRFASHLGDDLRWHYVATSWPVLKAYLPWGSGFGSFSAVYVEAEPLATLGEFTFAHHAHNELIELAIEGGLPALLLVAAFLCILAVGARQVFRAAAEDGHWRRAALVAIAVALLHSLVDYPLRTFACSIPLALALAVLVQAPGNRVARATSTPRRSRRGRATLP
jgi:O-antigen ligase